MKVVAIIVNYYSGSFLSDLIKILQNEKPIEKIIVADNGDSFDVNKLIGGFLRVEVISFQKNIGFGAAVNYVVKKIKREYYLLINPDTIPTPGFADRMINGLTDSRALVAGPRFFWDIEKKFRLPPALDETWFNSCSSGYGDASDIEVGMIADNWIRHHDWFWQQDSTFNESFLSGACLMIKHDRSFFRDGKIFDERFFLYYEDTDLCMRVRMENEGVVCVPDAEVVHFWDQSPSEKKETFMAESREKYFKKFYNDALLKHSGLKIAGDPDKDVTKLGKCFSSPTFTTGENFSPNILYFEIGLNPMFVPFAQTVAKETYFKIPDALWNNLKPGVYYSRFRTRYNRQLMIWKWEKV